MSFGARPRAVLASLGTLGLLLAAAVSPASAAGGTPITPTQLFNGYRNCSTDADRPTYLPSRSNVVVEGIPGTTDTTDNSPLTARYQVWPVTDPSQTTTVTHDRATPGFEATSLLPNDMLVDGQTYAWRAQTVAGDAASDWSVPCYVTIDDTFPASVPTISSPNYPPDRWNQGGDPVTITLNANGADDVAGFQYSWTGSLETIVLAHIGDHGIPQPNDPYADPGHFTRADAPGGSATVNLIPPYGGGFMTLWVRSLDRAFHPSETTSYQFHVSPTPPTVTPADPAPEFGDTTTFTFRPDATLQSKSPVVSYSVHTFGGPHGDKTVDVAAAADGTATTELTMDGIDGEHLQVTSKSANGWLSDAASWDIYYDTTPTVASDVYPENDSGGGVGVPGTFTFTPKVKGIASYTYSFNGDPEVTVAAGAHDTASVDWTPTSDGSNELQVYATTSSGIQLSPYYYYFTVN
ncbi:hypothetical protein OG585_38225 [Streptomyces sp. NBC_01340]|uniref:hypothetical protein n=1 Tax=unclassified Streptomyces TaxID=2593676 RepID=UPI00224D4FDD|nr:MULTISPECIES: hypothetical protein [unclassified Streptomyces]MCX4458359.1 hypothetical protein [Streptomyces sp. NBC_01719]MCX4497716.1 hypothetical protein [Streptomyces sp. NBC_01728]MCX4596286.1 hypothetical protein [Streptomyces sp. NBC_01549]WSI44437.1 hypothetical protein OG585_38225 [Streptomyces sp. NBC_01340]